MRSLFLCIILLGAIITEVNGQTSSFEERRSALNSRQEATRTQIQDLQEQINNYQERLGNATERYDETFQQYEELTRLIRLQEEKIRQMRREQNQIEQEIDLVEENLQMLETELNELVDKYQSTLTYIYKHGRTTELALLLTSASLNQLMVRSYYLNLFDQHSREQVEEIRRKQQEYENTREELAEARKENREALESIETEIEQLAQKEEQQKRNVAMLKRDRNNLENQVKIRQDQLNELSETLSDLISEEQRLEEAEAERRRNLAAASEIEDDDERMAAEERYSTPIGSARPVSAEEMVEFESRFENLRGQMPWPVDNGLITERFGERVHPVFGTKTNVPGVDIAASPRSEVRAVSDGYVFEIVPVSDFGEVVLVKHGSYYTAYGNLSSIYARKNQVVRQGDILGLSGDENNIRGEVLLFLIRDGREFVNPENWLRDSLQ